TKFVAMIGVDDGPPPQTAPPSQPPAPGAGPQRASAPPAPQPPGSVVFGAWVDGKKAFESDVMHRGDAPKPVSIELAGAQKLVLAVIDANDGTAGDNAEWAGAVIITKSGQQSQPKIASPAPEAATQIAPSPATEIKAGRRPAPMINYPRITGATPGR